MSWKKGFAVLSLSIAILLVLTACGTERTPSDEKGDTLQGDEMDAAQETTYSRVIQTAKKRLELLQTVDPVDRDALWELYTGLVELQYDEYTFKGGLYAEISHEAAEGYTNGEGQELLDTITREQAEMQNFFSEQIISDWTLKMLDRVIGYIELGKQYAVTDKDGNIDVDASWERYIEERIDLNEVLGLDVKYYGVDYDGEIVSMDLPDGSAFDETGNCETDFGHFWMYVSETEVLQSQIDWQNAASLFSPDLISGFKEKGYAYYPDTKGVALPVSWGPTEGACLYFETAKGSSCSITMNLFFFKQGLFYQIGFESFDREDCLSACVEILNSVEVVGYPLEGFDAKNMISRSPTDVYTPYVEADRGIIVNTEYYTATLPLSWFDCYVRSIDWEGYRYALRFYEVNSYQDAWETAMQSGTYNTYEEYAELVGTQNGLLFEILIRMQGDDLSDLGDYIIWKSLDIDGEMCDIIIHYPHEETYSAATEARYLRMKQDIPQILDSLALR